MEIPWISASFVWGLPIKDYMAEFSHQTASKNKPTRHEIKQAIELIQSGYPSCAHFELLLSLANQTGYFRTFINSGLVPGCMRLLREYCQTNSIFDHAYGVLCIRTLALILQVGMVETIDPEILDNYDAIPISHYGKAGSISGFMRQLLLASIENSHQNQSLLQEFQWYEQNDRLACLPVVGGFTSVDVDFLLNRIDKSAVPCQIVMRSMRIDGFATILFLMWQHLLFIESKVATCSALMNLIFRYFPFSFPVERDPLRLMLDRLGCRIIDLSGYPRFLPTDTHDMRTAIESFRNKLREPYEQGESMRVLDAAILTEFLSGELSMEIVDSLGPLLKDIFKRCWVEMEGPKKERKHGANIMLLCGRGLLVIKPKLMRDDFASDLLRSLNADVDFIGLLGRVMLMGLRPYDTKEDQEEQDALTIFTGGVDMFFNTLLDYIRPLLPFIFQEDSCHDWLVVINHLNHPFLLAQHTDEYIRCVQTCWGTWNLIGTAMDYKSALMSCAYPRCAGNLGVLECARCKEAVYCSRNCQSLHWLMRGSEAHRLSCKAVTNSE